MFRAVDARSRSTPGDRYSIVAIVLHWVIAAGITAQLALGWRLEDLDGFVRSSLLQAHKSIGVTVLILTVARLVWRLVNPPPPYPAGLGRIERRLAHLAHIGFYALLLGLPLTGWALVSAGRPGGMKLFGSLPWPSFPLLSLLPAKIQEALADVFDTSHGLLADVAIALVVLHVAAALKHQLISRDPTLSRMVPGVRPGQLANPRLLAIPAGVALVAAAAYLPQPKAPPPRPKPASLAQAELYLDIVGPALTRRCASCHNDDEARGGLSLVNYAALLQGGIDGPVLKPGDPLHSELFHRVTLPRADKLYMPQNGKPPLNRSQTAALRLWIQLGAPRTGLAGRFKLDAAQTMSLQNALASLGGGEETSTDEFAVDKSLPAVSAAPAAVRSHLEGAGFVVRPLSRASHLLVVDFTASRPLNADDFASLGRIGPQVRALNLSEGQAKDAQLKALAPLTNLVRLRLDDDPITDAGLANLAPLKSLTYLNLVGSKITDAGLSQLDALPRLHELYLWDTAVTPQAVERFKAGHPDVRVYAGLKPADVAKEPRMAPVN